MRYYTVLMLLLMCLVVSCGGGNDGGNGSPSDTQFVPLLVGQFIDSPVGGIRYNTTTHSGVTDAAGTFYYRQGEIVTFKIGGSVLGSASGDPLITPVDLVPGATDENNSQVTNIARLLQFLDDDGDPENGIFIPQKIRDEMENLTLEFSSPAFGHSPVLIDFINKLISNGVFSDQRRFVSAEQARAHLRKVTSGKAPDPLPEADRIVDVLEDSPTFATISSKALAFDSLAHPHFVIGGDHLYHHLRDDNGWHTEIIDKDVSFIITSRLPQLFVDSADFLHIFYLGDQGKFKYATNRPGYWSIEILESGIGAAAVDGGGHCHLVSYNALTKKLEYSNNTEDFREKESFDPGAVKLGLEGDSIRPDWMALTVDVFGKAHLAFTQTEDEAIVLKYATNASGTWRTERITSEYSASPKALDISVDHQAAPHIGYGFYEIIHGTKMCNPNVCDNGDQLQYFTKKKGIWESEILDGSDFSKYISLSTDISGRMYRVAGNSSSLYFATNADGYWQAMPEMRLSLDWWDSFSTAVDPSGRFCAVYLNNGTLVFASKTDSEVKTETIFKLGRIGEFPSLVRDKAGNLHISYWDSSNRAVKYASNRSGSWVTNTVWSDVDTEKPTSIMVDAFGNAHIGVTSTGELKYANNATGRWQMDSVGVTTAIDHAGMVVDTAGIPRTLYLDSADWAWMYAEKPDDKWRTEKVVNVFLSSSQADVTLSPTDTVYICFDASDSPFYSGLDPGLWLGWKAVNADAWQFKQIEKNGVRSYCNIAVDDLGVVHVAYQKAGFYSYQLIYTTETSTGWNPEVIVQGSHTGEKISLSLDRSGSPVITYYDAGNGAVNYAYKGAAGWVSGRLAKLITYDFPDFRAPVSIGPSGQLQAIYFDHELGDLNVVTILKP